MKKQSDLLTSPKKIEYRYYHWGPFLFKTQITPEECQLLLKEGKKRRKKSHDYREHLAGHLSEEYELKATEKIRVWLKKYLTAYASGWTQWRGYGTMKPNFTLHSLWINYMKANEFNPPHFHNMDLSFVLYVHVPKEILEEHKNFKGTVSGPGGICWVYGEGDEQHIRMVHLMPKTGNLFIFPASLAHWVFPFRSKVERISVSGNILLDQDSRKGFI